MSIDIAEIREKIKHIIVTSLELEIQPSSIDDERLLFTSALAAGMDLDSLAAIEIVIGLSNEFGLELDEVPREAFQNVATLADFIAVQLNSKVAV
jgi:acyl carrier protein